MSSYVLLPYLIMAATLGRALLVAAKLAPETRTADRCNRCGLPRERRELGQAICVCERDALV